MNKEKHATKDDNNSDDGKLSYKLKINNMYY